MSPAAHIGFRSSDGAELFGEVPNQRPGQCTDKRSDDPAALDAIANGVGDRGKDPANDRKNGKQPPRKL
jgi:hypothetical protein